MKAAGKCLLAVWIASLPGVLYARPSGIWKPIGPEGGWVLTIGTSPANSSIYLATGGGFDGGGLSYHSPDGVTWVQGGNICPLPLQIAVDAADPNTALAACHYFGVFRTADGGSTWATSLFGQNILAYGIAADPVTPGVFFVASNLGVFQTTDAGLHWSGPKGTQSFLQPTSILINPENHLEVFGTAYPGLARSEDGGMTWSLGAAQYFEYPASLAFDASLSVLYSATINGQVIRSADKGSHWGAAGSPLPADVFALSASRTRGIVFAGTALGLFRSTDGGDHWDPTSIVQIAILGLTVNSAGDVLAATSSGVFSSADDGLTWTPRNTGFIRTNVVSFAPSFANSGDLFTVTADGSLSLWSQAAQRWTLLPTGALRDFDSGGGIGVVATTVSDPSLVFAAYSAGCAYPSDSLHSADTTASTSPLFVSRDGGATWSPTSGSASVCDTTLLLVDPLDSSTLFKEQPFLGGGLERTTDQGTTWAGIAKAFTSLIIDASSVPETIGGSNGYLAARSVDGGQTWSEASPGLSIDHLATASFGGEIYANSVEGQSSQTSEVVYRSSDHGQTWNPTSFSSNTVSTLAVDPGNSHRVFVASDRGIFESLDSGETWGRLPALNASLPVALAVSPDGRELFAATTCCGAWGVDSSLLINPVTPPVVAPIVPGPRVISPLSGWTCTR